MDIVTKEYRILPQVLKDDDIIKYVSILKKIAEIDGLDISETSYLLDKAVNMGASNKILDFILNGKVTQSLGDLLSFFKKEDKFRLLLFRDAVEMTKADGKVTDKERIILDKIGDQLEIDNGMRLLVERYVNLQAEASALSTVLFL